MEIADRPTEMLLRQLDALRKAIRYRNRETGRRHYCHVQNFRKPFADSVREIRAELVQRGVIGLRPYDPSIEVKRTVRDIRLTVDLLDVERVTFKEPA